MRVWPGRPYPLGATWDGAGRQLRPLLRACHQGRAVPVRLRRTRPTETQRIHAARAHRPGLARLPARRAARPALRLPRPRPVRAGEGPSLQPATSSCSTPTPRRSAATCAGTTRCSATRSATRTPTCPSTSATAPPSRRWPRSSTPPSPGATTGRRARPGTRRSSTSCTSRASPSGIPTCPRSCAAPTPGWPPRRPSSTCSSLGVTAVELMPVHHHVDDRHLVEKGLRNYWGYNTLAFFAPDLRYASGALAARSRCTSSR